MAELIAVGGHAVFQFKDLIGVLVDLVLGGGGEAHQGGVEIGKDVPVLVVDGPVGLVADDQVEVAAGEQLALLVLYRVDAVHHGLVGGKDAAGGGVVLLLAQIGDGQAGQQVDKAALGLGDQGIAVGQEQDVFHPAVAQEHVTQGDYRPGFARAGGHDQQGLASAARKAVAHRLDGALLIPAPGDILVHRHAGQACSHGPQVKELVQVPPGVDGRHPPLGIGTVINAGVEPVGEEDHRPAAVLLFQNVGIQPGLMAAPGHVGAGALGLDHRQGPAVGAVEHIVGKTLPRLVGHPVELHLVQPVLPLGPAGVQKHGVDIQLAGLVLAEVQGLGHIGLLLLLPPGGELRLEGLILCDEGIQVHVGDSRSRDSGGGLLLQKGAVKLPLLIVGAVAVGHKVQEYVQVLQTQLRLGPGQRLAPVGGGVAHAADVVHPLPQVLPHNLPELPVVHQVYQGILPGLDQRVVHRVHPLDPALHRPPAVQYAGGQVDLQDFLRRYRGRSKRIKLWVGEETVEVGHGVTPVFLELQYEFFYKLRQIPCQSHYL